MFKANKSRKIWFIELAELAYQLKEEIGRGVLNKDKFSVVDSLKLRINSIQDDICEGIKIRAKIEDKLKGEKVRHTC